MPQGQIQRVLVLSGGAGKGIYEAACLKALLAKEPGLDFDCFVGISAGALNSAYLAQVPMQGASGFGTAASCAALRAKVDALLALWTGVGSYRNVYKGKLSCKARVFWRVFVCRNPAAVDASPIRAMIDQHIQTAAVAASGRRLLVGATDLDTGEDVKFDETFDDIPAAVKASAAIPAFFSPVEIGGKRYVDGALRHNTPLSLAYKERPALEVVAIQTTPIRISNASTGELDASIGETTRRKTRDALDVLGRAAMIMSEEVQKDDVQGAWRWARALQAVQAAGVTLPPDVHRTMIPTRIWAPKDILLEDEKVFEQDDLDRMSARGAEDGVDLPVLTF